MPCWKMHLNAKFSTAFFVCKNLHGNYILFQQPSCLVGFFKVAWVLVVKVCVEV